MILYYETIAADAIGWCVLTGDDASDFLGKFTVLLALTSQIYSSHLF